ncbi:hypothetical protein NDU88_004380 [Pleurodeles waltl]|uniref:Uncharacterized protein n=1 Tax=Pleurodeles waltl TaxID=8319 RepID=A0AAV7T7M3_PLEWA|nr:hypothetical protein NDU88_004380 [Pleurodeles waltl]
MVTAGSLRMCHCKAQRRLRLDDEKDGSSQGNPTTDCMGMEGMHYLRMQQTSDKPVRWALFAPSKAKRTRQQAYG